MKAELTTLDNGMRVVTERMDGLKSASLGIWVAAGSRHERPEQAGIAHFLEHMAFKGTERRSALQIAEEVENLGASINAYTSKEATAYFVRVLEDDVAQALDVISDIVLNPVFAVGELETERGVILQEIGQMLDTPDDLVFEWLQEVAYPDQPMGQSILGPSENIAAFGRDDLIRFVDDHYRPKSMILAAAGAVEHGSIVEFANRVFRSLPGQSGELPVPARYGGGERRELKDLEQAQFAFALEAPGVRDPDIYASHVHAIILGGGMSSRLFQTIREQHGLCYAIGASVSPYSDTGTLTVYSGTSGGDIAALSRLCMDELRRIAVDVTEAEVARARTQMKAGMLMALESASNRCERLARSVLVWDRVVELDEVVAKIDSVTRDGVAEFAERQCRSGNPSLALYGPVADAPPLSELSDMLSA